MKGIAQEEEDFIQAIETHRLCGDYFDDRAKIKLAFIKGCPFFEVKRESVKILEIIA